LLEEYSLYLELARVYSILMKNLKELLKSIKCDVEKLAPGVEVYLFGSYAESRATAGSDVDILVVVESVSEEEAYRIKAHLKRKYIEYPLEVHVVPRSLYERLYKRFISNMIPV